MANKHIYGWNIITDFLVTLIIEGVDIINPNLKSVIEKEFGNFLQMYLINPKDVVFLDFEIVEKNGDSPIIILGNNILSSLWLMGIIPYDSLKTLRENKFEMDNIGYFYNKKTRKLTIKKLKIERT